MKLILGLLAGKIIALFSRFLKIGGGSAAPGLWALRIEPLLIEKLIKKIPKNIVITGTNGKTTTARILTHISREAGLKVIRNHTGSNLERGIASALISHTRGDMSRHLGIWELDEAAFNSVVPKINPDIIVFLNVSRDQLDRYGEVDKIVNNWCYTLSKLDPQTLVLINADEPDLAKLKNSFKGKIEEFGKKDLKNIKSHGLRGSSFELSIVNCQLSINLPLPGMYNIYNALAAITCAKLLNLPLKNLTNFQPAFGRFEKLVLSGSEGSHPCYILLIKNPAGATEVFKTLAPLIKPQDKLLLALNDNIADGTDVSWIWDAEFEYLPKNHIYVSGKRAYDLAVRLKYADLKAVVEPNLKKALQEARKGLKGSLFILPTYTAMLELQKILKKHYWEES